MTYTVGYRVGERDNEPVNYLASWLDNETSEVYNCSYDLYIKEKINVWTKDWATEWLNELIC